MINIVKLKNQKIKIKFYLVDYLLVKIWNWKIVSNSEKDLYKILQSNGTL